VRWGKTWRLLQKVTYHNKADYSADCFAAAEVLHMGALHPEYGLFVTEQRAIAARQCMKRAPNSRATADRVILL